MAQMANVLEWSVHMQMKSMNKHTEERIDLAIVYIRRQRLGQSGLGTRVVLAVGSQVKSEAAPRALVLSGHDIIKLERRKMDY